MKIVLIRHGETEWNRELRLQGRTDIPLSPEGIAQMKQAGELLKALPFSIDKVVSSPLTRARQTAEILSEALGLPANNITIEPLFIERNFGAGEAVSADNIHRSFHIFVSQNGPLEQFLIGLNLNIGLAAQQRELFHDRIPPL